MKIPDFRAAAERYELREDRYGRYPEVPDELGPIHAVPGHRDGKKHHDPLFGSYEAACGRYVRVLFPVSFDTDEDDACSACLEMTTLWVNDRDQYHRRVRERRERRWVARQRADEEEQAQRDYEEFLERQDADLNRRSQQQEHDEAG